MTKLSQKVFYSDTAMSLTWPWQGESKSLLLVCSDASYSAMMQPSQKVFYSSAMMFPTQL